ncbi:Na(+), Li(+), K(+)/H(+) antiporter [Sutcliffiella rhizosphaerae]|uniref:Na(+), Li(+), K(+)/H(+) antiporter n=2 Tax=Sutcliffiella rhizosphaerae TaxID=2880967 RepID=A0ABN8AHY8_9BACI|nr:Na(+), Li(+), K(+)/H(+) antiporter [Sutcliffiella rhizosphaerae]
MLKMPRSLWLLVIGMAINVTGASFLWPLNTIYIHDILGKSLSVAGLVLMVNAGASVIGNLIGGFLFDKIGGYRSILLGISITIIALIGMTINHTWNFYIIFLTIIGFGSGIVFPSMYAMAGSVWKEGGRKAFNAMYVSQNLGVAVGAALGGLVAGIRFDYIFLANTITYAIFLIIALFGYRHIQANPIVQTSVLDQKGKLKDHTKLYALLTICIGYLLCWMGYVQWQTTIATHTQSLGILLTQYSILWTINGALIVLAQPVISFIVKRYTKTLKTQINVGLVIFIISFAVVGVAEQYTAFVVAMIIMTIGEMFVWPAVPTVANDLAPKGREGFYQGIVNSTATGGRMLGPLMGGLLVDFYGMGMLFGILMVLMLVAIFTTTIYDRKLKVESNAVKSLTKSAS